MTSTVARPRAGGFPRRSIAMAIAGLALAAGIGYAVSDNDGAEPVGTGVQETAVDGADRAYFNRAEEIVAERKALLNQATTGAGS